MDSNQQAGFDVGKALAEAARTFFRPQDVDETIAEVTRSATTLIHSADYADVLVIAGEGKFESHAATSDIPTRLDTAQEQTGEGPCVDAAVRTGVVRCDDFETDDRWPTFTPKALEMGIRSSLSFHLYASDKAVGGLNLLSRTPHAFTSEDEEVGTVLATHAAVALYAANLDRRFNSALASRDSIGQAKGMLMERYGIGAVQAFDMLSTLSEEDNIPIAELVRDIIDRGSDNSPH